MNKNFLKVTMAALLGMTLGGCDTGDDKEEFSRTTLYLKDSSGAGVAGIQYSWSGGEAEIGDISTSGNTPSTGEVAISYWPGYDASCSFTFDNVPQLYLFGTNGPINDIRMQCTDGVSGVNPGALNNAPSGTCIGYFVIN